MNQWSAEILEFEALRALLGRYVNSPGGRALLREVAPSSDRAVLAEWHADLAEAIAYSEAAAQTQAAARGAAIRPRFDNLPDTAELLAKLGIEGAVLDGLEVRSLVTLLDRACDVRAMVGAAAGRFPRLGSRVSMIAEFRPLVDEISPKIEPDGRVAGHASVALARIRRDIERQQRLIRESLDRFLRAHRDDGILQEDFVAIRNERFVLPIVAGQKRRVDGVIHAASGTGHTLFIEPLETVEMNNDLVRLGEQELREVFRILEEITGRFRAALEDVRAAVAVLAEIELLFAKARFAADFNGRVPVFAPEAAPKLVLRDARHPLLVDVLRRQGGRVVPLSLGMESGTRTLLISGPNTGGKTVSLKTVGLTVLMAQSGLPVLAASAELPVFEQVLADIGDHQSLEASLSSFSAHMARIREIANEVGPDALVLLDEVGRATDPDEGGALAVAILDWMRRAEAFTLASTHLVAPKIYGATTDGVLNAAMSFDEETLAPTYHMRTGVPGASAGLAIAQRLGLPGLLMDRARAALSNPQRDIARFLEVLEEKTAAVARREEDLRARQAAVEVERTKGQEALERKEAARIAELERRTDQLLAEFEARAWEAIGRIGSPQQQKKAAHQVAQVKREIREQVAGPAVTAEPAAAGGVREGVRVRLRGVREPARVRRLLGTGAIEVEAGFLKLQVAIDDVTEILPETPEAARVASRGISVRTAPREAPVSREINLIGRRAEEAVAEVDKFLDSAALASLTQVRIVHGHGMGVLRKAIADLLTGHPLVEKFYPAPPREGGAGATIVELAPEI